ncbi:hypothetical protein N7519_001385 [Penicillium mononematosum]|uniref:uncharacterized protein n=1 Tax=Penicillium mononematosum TaxID=268346 RepID=UPI002546D178|nr:uncharacterized protein N7519_001385 [Penicillium mononematosum]KAJ6191364.1 hypothetical protein N7519_001385 [Penicillium mononematosum]
MQAGIADLGATIEKPQMSEPEVCLRWIYYNSKLQKGDSAGVILELPPHIKNIANGPLPAETLKEMLTALEETAW